MTSYSPKAIAMSKAGIIKLTYRGSERIVSDEKYRAWNEEYKKTLPQPRSQPSYGKRPAQIQYVDTNRTQTTPQMNYWMLTLPILVLAVVLIGGRK